MPKLLKNAALSPACITVSRTVGLPDMTDDTMDDWHAVLPATVDTDDADRFWPMMTALWPTNIHVDLTPEDAATLIDRHAGCTTLMEGPDGFFIGLTGGGMDLSWDIAMAYICCGMLPPARIMLNLPGFDAGKRARRVLSTAPRVARALRDKAANVLLEAKRQRAFLARA